MPAVAELWHSEKTEFLHFYGLYSCVYQPLCCGGHLRVFVDIMSSMAVDRPPHISLLLPLASERLGWE